MGMHKKVLIIGAERPHPDPRLDQARKRRVVR